MSNLSLIFVILYLIHSIMQPGLCKDTFKYVSGLIYKHDGVYKSKMIEIQLHTLSLISCILVLILYVKFNL
jgi:hypothetical protein